MSHTTQTIHVRGVWRSRLLAAVDARMVDLGYRAIFPEDLQPGEPDLRRFLLRRDGRWLTLVDEAGFDPRLGPRDAPGSDLESWGAHLSRALSRSVLTIYTWDGEATVVATRWHRGRPRRVLTLLEEAYRGDDGLPYAPARVLWPWLPPARREAILAAGIALTMPAAGTTGHGELDALLEGYDDDDREGSDDDDDFVFVDESISVAAIGAAAGMRAPLLHPHDQQPGDERHLYVR